MTAAAPYSRRLDPSVREVRVLFGCNEAWARAKREAADTILIEPGKSYRLDCVAGRDVLLIAVEYVSGDQVHYAVEQLLIAGAKQVAAISEHGFYKMFQPKVTE